MELNQPTTALDLARSLNGESGTFIAQQGGQNFLVTAAEGHSIKSLRPVGQRSQTVPATIEPWTITKISNQDISVEYDQQQPQQRRQ
jgi:hypothetical protein